MRVLALDTTTRAGSVAVVDENGVLFAERGDPSRSHAERLPGDLIRGMAAAGLPWKAIDLFAVASGPGSFTGLRIGIATIQGLAFVGGKRIVPVSALLALGYGAAAGVACGEIVGAWIDAHRREVFSALYRVRDTRPYDVNRLEEIEPAAVGDPAATWLRWTDLARPAAVAGDGAVLYSDVFGGAARVVEPLALAPIIGWIAMARARCGETVDPAAVQPLYVRRPDAEIARDVALESRPRDR
ncbi:MAG: tRNA (adenosine(37)-N6)-threonylcarbamoyltransferase complex dimerization subunit type 1 TsaB [Luteitalea sp.]|nr:tRNA (adenosine(37)-N6)-threonylcarbamoyltransferase complex dimerization subunit type 1 TsaB [Luteitalea sp.]